MKINPARISERLDKNFDYSPKIFCQILGLDPRAIHPFINAAKLHGHYFEVERRGDKGIHIFYRGHFPDLNLSDPVGLAVARLRLNPNASAATLKMSEL